MQKRRHYAKNKYACIYILTSVNTIIKQKRNMHAYSFVPLRGIRNINSNKNGFGILPRVGLDPLLFAFSAFLALRHF